MPENIESIKSKVQLALICMAFCAAVFSGVVKYSDMKRMTNENSELAKKNAVEIQNIKMTYIKQDELDKSMTDLKDTVLEYIQKEREITNVRLENISGSVNRTEKLLEKVIASNNK